VGKDALASLIGEDACRTKTIWPLLRSRDGKWPQLSVHDATLWMNVSAWAMNSFSLG
jgi:hypothetical protein